MKKFWTLLFLFPLLAGSTSAQILKVGIKGGINTTSHSFRPVELNGMTVSKASSGIGYHLGLAARLSIPKFLQIQPELLYSTRDYHYMLDGDRTLSKVRISAKRLELPVMVGFNIKAFRIFAGPVFRLSTSLSGNGAQDFTVKYDDSAIAIQAGVGFDIHKFFIDARYTTYPGNHYEQFSSGKVSKKVKITTDDQWYVSLGFFF